MTPKLLLAEFGSTIKTAVAIGYSEASVRNWVKANKIPFKAQRIIQSVTEGKLVATVAKKTKEIK